MARLGLLLAAAGAGLAAGAVAPLRGMMEGDDANPKGGLFGKKVTVQTDRGAVKGKYQGDVAVFHSVPFAAPPVGDLRFRAPKDVEPWEGTLDASGLKAICPQVSLKQGSYLYLGEEDCLHMHVYAPKKAIEGGEKLPVMFWIFGGAYDMGDGIEFGFYDGQQLADEYGVVVMAPNYRVGPFGFLASEALRDEDADGSTGNMGVRDQRMALDFAKRNAAAFGGDPDRITIFGESAGGFSVCYHVSHGAYSDLFTAAIMESGSCDTTEFFLQPREAFNVGKLLIEAIGCEEDDLECLRALEPKDILYGVLSSLKTRDVTDENGLPVLTPIGTWGPVIDGTTVGLPKMPLQAIEAGEGVQVPMLLGTNHNEGSIFVPAVHVVFPHMGLKFTDEDLEVVLHHVLDPRLGRAGVPPTVAPVMAQYPKDDFKSQDERFATLIRDYIFVCPTRRVARAVSAYSDAYLYHFTYPEHWLENKVLGEYHSSELTFVFGNKLPFFYHHWNKDDYAMKALIQGYWTTFAKTHDPNPATEALDAGNFTQGVHWPAWASAADEGGANIYLDVVPTTDTGFMKDNCDFFDDYLHDH